MTLSLEVTTWLPLFDCIIITSIHFLMLPYSCIPRIKHSIMNYSFIVILFLLHESLLSFLLIHYFFSRFVDLFARAFSRRVLPLFSVFLVCE